MEADDKGSYQPGSKIQQPAPHPGFEFPYCPDGNPALPSPIGLQGTDNLRSAPFSPRPGWGFPQPDLEKATLGHLSEQPFPKASWWEEAVLEGSGCSGPAGVHQVPRTALSHPGHQSHLPTPHCQGPLPARLGDDHLCAQLMEFVPELLGLQAAGDFGHFLAGNDGGGGDQRLGAQRGGRWAAAASAATKLPVSIQAGQLSEGLGAGRLLHKLFCERLENDKSTPSSNDREQRTKTGTWI